MMSEFIRAPVLPPAVAKTDNTVALWYKKPGDRFKPNEPLLAIYTSQGAMEILAPDAGVLATIVKAGTAKVTTDQILGAWLMAVSDATPFTTGRMRAVQNELIKGERRFGKISHQNRKDPPEASAGQGMQQTTTLKSHPLLANSQMWAGMAENDSWIANSDTLVEYFEAHPELVNDPELRMQLENAKRNELAHNTTPKPTPFGT